MPRNSIQFRGMLAKNRKTLLFCLLCIVSLGLIPLSSRIPDLPRPGVIVASWLQRAFSNTGAFFFNTIRSVRELGQLRNEYESLLAQLQEYELLAGNVTTLQAEVARLRQLLGFAQHLEYNTIAAEVVGKESGNIFSAITINKGLKDGVLESMPVIAIQDGKQVLVGKIARTHRNSAHIEPIFDTRSFVATRLTRSRFEGLMQGGGSPNRPLIMRHVDVQGRNIIQYGDDVQTSGLSSIYPTNIPIGLVSKIRSKPHELTLEIEIEPLINFARLEYVFIVNHQNNRPLSDVELLNTQSSR